MSSPSYVASGRSGSALLYYPQSLSACTSTDPSPLLPHLPPSCLGAQLLVPSLPLLSLHGPLKLACLHFGFPLFLPSSVPPLIAPLFLASQGCQLSGHSWKIHSRHGNCKQTEETARDLQTFTAHRQKAEWRNSKRFLVLELLWVFFSFFSSLSSLLIQATVILSFSASLFVPDHSYSLLLYMHGQSVSCFTTKGCMELCYVLKCVPEAGNMLEMLFGLFSSGFPCILYPFQPLELKVDQISQGNKCDFLSH